MLGKAKVGYGTRMLRGAQRCVTDSRVSPDSTKEDIRYGIFKRSHLQMRSQTTNSDTSFSQGSQLLGNGRQAGNRRHAGKVDIRESLTKAT
jgi:hypothetical protein